MLLHNRIRDMKPGETLQLLATDPSTQRDIPRFCEFLGHELLQAERVDEQYLYILRKQESR